MITYYNCRPGPPAKMTTDNAPRRRIRWTIKTAHNRKKSLSLEDAVDIRNTLRTDSSSTLTAISAELRVSMDTLKAMLAEHGLELNFHYKK